MRLADPDWKPGVDWTHRIDAVPERYRDVQIRFADGTVRDARTVPATPFEQIKFKGIGDWVAYQTACGRYLARDVTHWKYV